MKIEKDIHPLYRFAETQDFFSLTVNFERCRAYVLDILNRVSHINFT